LSVRDVDDCLDSNRDSNDRPSLCYQASETARNPLDPVDPLPEGTFVDDCFKTYEKNPPTSSM
jgi:hypothetical protein